MSLEAPKPMATVLADPDYALQNALAGLSGVSGVLSVHTRWIENTLNVWIGIRDDDRTRDLVYALEDSFLDRFKDLAIDFHVLTIPNGRRIEDYISDAQTFYQRAV